MRCQICGEIASKDACHSSLFKYKGVNLQDILHVDIAKINRCDRLITADQAFDELVVRATPMYIEIV